MRKGMDVLQASISELCFVFCVLCFVFCVLCFVFWVLGFVFCVLCFVGALWVRLRQVLRGQIVDFIPLLSSVS